MRNNDLSKLAKKIEKEAQHEGELKEILNDSFISRKTEYNTYEEFMSSLPVNFDEIDNPNLQEIENEDLDNHIRSNTRYDSWISFINAAAEEFMVKKLEKLFK